MGPKTLLLIIKGPYITLPSILLSWTRAMVRSSRLALLAGLAQALMVSELFTAPRPRPGRPRPGGPRLRSICRASPEDYWKVLGRSVWHQCQGSQESLPSACQRRASRCEQKPRRLEALAKTVGGLWKVNRPRSTEKSGVRKRRDAPRGLRKVAEPTPPTQGLPQTGQMISESLQLQVSRRRGTQKKWAAAGWDAFQDILRRADSLRQPTGIQRRFCRPRVPGFQGRFGKSPAKTETTQLG